MNPLLLSDPRTFLLPARYVDCLLRQPSQIAGILLGAGLFLLILGEPLERLSAMMLGGLYGYVLGGLIATTFHYPLAVLTIAGLVVGIIGGCLLHHGTIGLCTGVILAVMLRALAAEIELYEYLTYIAAGTLAASWLLGMLAHRTWSVLMTAALGAAVVAFSLPSLISRRLPFFAASKVATEAPFYGTLIALLFLAGLVAQTRLNLPGLWARLPRPWSRQTRS